MKRGRPTSYKEEYCNEVQNYLDLCIDVESEFHKTRGERSDTYERKLTVKLPTIEGFALHLKVNKTSLYEWDKKYPKFSNSLDLIKTEQRNRLLNKGLSGDYNSTIAKLILSSNHGMSEKVIQELSGKDGGAIEINSVKEMSDDELLGLTTPKVE